MISKSKIEFFQKTILHWYNNNGRRFHWRKRGLTNYQYIIAEVLLQRTKAETIAKFYPDFITRFPNWKALVNSNIKEIENYLRPVGLYRQRSRRLMNLAIEMYRLNGKLPRDRKELEAIPFMGQYIANAVELLIFDQCSPLVDVNMSRVLERFFGPRKMADIRYDQYLQNLAKEIVDHANAKELNWGVLDFAAIVCKIKPDCGVCGLRKNCLYFKIYVNDK